MSGDEFDALQALAADNARLCAIVIAAEKLAAEAARMTEDYGDSIDSTGLKVALDAFKVKRQGT